MKPRITLPDIFIVLALAIAFIAGGQHSLDTTIALIVAATALAALASAIWSAPDAGEGEEAE